MAKPASQKVKDAVQTMNRYGGKGPFRLPVSHKAAMRVPRNGAACSKCQFLGEDGGSCENKFFIAWNGGSKRLPAPANQYCSDWFTH